MIPRARKTIRNVSKVDKVERPSYKDSHETEVSEIQISEDVVLQDQEIKEKPWWVRALSKWWFRVSFSHEEIEALLKLDEGVEYFGDHSIKELLERAIALLESGERDTLENFFKSLGFDKNTREFFGFDHKTAGKFKELLIKIAEEPEDTAPIWPQG